MTTNTSQRRAGVLGIHSIDHFCLSVPKLEQAASFYEAFGLGTTAQGQTLALSATETSHHWGLLREGPRKKLHHLSFGVFAEDLPKFRERLQARRIEILPPPPGCDDAGIWFHGFDGLLTELRVAEKCSPNAPSQFGLELPASPSRGTYSRSKAPKVHPRRLSHVAIYTSDVIGAIAFYSDVLGLRLSDRSADLVAFLHSVHGSDHHLVALVKSDGPGFHHCSWDVGSVQEVGLGSAQMATQGHVRGWGLGRHVLGSNYFHYVRDPWGSYSEYSAGMDFIPATVDWQASDQPVDDAMFLWGPPPPEDFVQNFELT